MIKCVRFKNLPREFSGGASEPVVPGPSGETAPSGGSSHKERSLETPSGGWEPRAQGQDRLCSPMVSDSRVFRYQKIFF